jgi:hypothetical protein
LFTALQTEAKLIAAKDSSANGKGNDDGVD